MDAHELPMALRSAYLAMHRKTDAKMASHGVTADQFVLLAELQRGAALTQRELARRMSSDPSTVRAMLVLLERRGLIERAINPDDARAQLVKVTPVGKRLFRKLWAESEEIRQEMLDAFSEPKAEQLVRALKLVAQTFSSSEP